MIRVLHVIWSLDRAGAENLLLNYLTHRNREDFEHHVVCLSGHDELAPSFEQVGIKPTFYPRNRYRSLPHLLAKARAEIRAWNPSILHLHRAGHDAALGLLALLCRPPHTVATEHSIFAVPSTPPSWLQWLRSRLRSRIDMTIAISNMVKDDLLRYRAVDPVKVTTIYNGIDTQRFVPCVKEPGKTPVIGSMGRLIPYKGHAVLIDAAAILRDRNIPCSIRILGDGPEKPALLERIRRHNLLDTVEIISPTEHPEAFLQDCDFFAFPSLIEGFGIACIEAMSTGLATAASALPSLSEIITDGENGLLFEPGSAEELSEALVRLLTQPDLAGALGSAARATVTDRFDIRDFARRYEDVYAQLQRNTP